ncbi:MAG: class I SAM-dependent methyltransferase [Actinobacteria bacterium]|nr:class I SAM-dependent methyltransferase [Actinomycetota bacterium]
MDTHLVGAYEADGHEAIARIIRRHSTNPADIRQEALRGIDLSGATRLLDVGCGYGAMVEALAGRIRPGVEVIGVDIYCSDEEVFVARARAITGSARFICRRLDSRLDFPDQYFDAVIAAYSLYFFPRLIPELARVLKPDGVLVSLTHSESNFQGMLAAMGVSPRQSAMHSLLSRFSAENGATRLAEHFGAVESRPYPNTLVFRAEDLEDYLALVRFKLPSLLPAGDPALGRPEALLAWARELLARAGCVSIEKDDAVFIATEPRRS